MFNPRPGREQNRRPQDWEAEILTTAPTPPHTLIVEISYWPVAVFDFGKYSENIQGYDFQPFFVSEMNVLISVAIGKHYSKGRISN